MTLAAIRTRLQAADEYQEITLWPFEIESVRMLLDVAEAAKKVETWGWGEDAPPGAIEDFLALHAALARLDAERSDSGQDT